MGAKGFLLVRGGAGDVMDGGGLFVKTGGVIKSWRKGGRGCS